MAESTPTSDPLQAKLDAVRIALSELHEAQSSKESALRSMRPADLLEASSRESDLAHRLAKLLLPNPAVGGSPTVDEGWTGSLREQIRQLPADAQATASPALEQLRQTARKLKSQIAHNWLTTWRLNEYVGEMLETIAHGGQPSDDDGYHGLMLDSTA